MKVDNAAPATPSFGNPNYAWDRAGNRTSLTDSAGPSYNYQTTSLNQYWTDGISNMTNGSEHELASYQNVNYSYINDSHVWLISGTDIFGQQSRYEMYYDALGRRCVSILNGSTTYYIYDGEKAILEYRGWSGGPSGTNVYGKSIDEILKRTDYTVIPARTVYYQDDHEGSITHLTDANGNVLEYYRYDVFGKPSIYNSSGQQIQTSAFGNRFMFTGREYVANFGVYEYRNRAYNPGLGRFMSEDPKLFDSKDYNLFRYCGNDPLDKVDAMGLGMDDLDPALWPYIDQAGRNVFDHYYNQNRVGPINPTVYPFKSEWASSVVRDNKTNKLSVTRETAKGSWDRVRPPSEVGKTNVFEVHMHTFPLVGFDAVTGSQFSWIDIAHIDAKLSLAGGLVLIPGGRQQLFIPDQHRLEFHGGTIYEASRENPNWTYLQGQQTDLRKIPGMNQEKLRAAANSDTVHANASIVEPRLTTRHRNDMIIRDTGESDGNLSGINPHLLQAGM